MSFERLAEQIIQEAMARGEFDDLPGRGKPVDLSTYFDTPADVRAAYALLKNAGMVPQEVELLQEIASLKEQMASARSQEQNQKLFRRMQELQVQFAVMIERRKRR
jgi:hypothetical protein